jgi:hypothetical protein
VLNAPAKAPAPNIVRNDTFERELNINRCNARACGSRDVCSELFRCVTQADAVFPLRVMRKTCAESLLEGRLAEARWK